ncbi:ATP-binding cassette domain-containing protein [Pseudactinotalea sp. HY160]|uniref:ABC transporter ATP-binding protein n=1 Tax=Pseudactinotalea sp. HY160 TaxID=2654490 RepID=UPI001313C697|nr:ATP-binding cassette domain-containing protein [Pseudactinotalea sp. HY160]
MTTSPPDPSVQVRDVVRRFSSVTALAGVSFEAAPGRITAVLGPNGAGKTTLMEICEGLQRADSGRVRVLGLDPARDAHLLRPRVGVMIQDGGLPGQARPMELLRHVAALYAHPRPVHDLAAGLGIDAFARTPVRRLSGGQRQRLALAIALVGRPELLFLDEPSAGLDPAARRAVWEIVAGLRDEGTTIVLTSHLMDEVEHLADQVVVIDGGHVVATGTIGELTALEGPRIGQAVRSLRVNGHITPADQRSLLEWAADRGLAVSERTLEDVFLDLTGRTLR